MLQNITLQYPSWFLILCILVGIAVSGLLYFRDRRFADQAKWLTPVLAILRFIAVSGLCFFLLAPLVKNTKENTQKPIVVVAKDISTSTLHGMTEEQATTYHESLDALSDKLKEKYEVATFSFSDNITEGLSDSIDGQISNLSSAMTYIQDNYADQNLGAVVFSSDGIYNEGQNPIYKSSKILAPIYTVALGDTTAYRDISVKNVLANKIVYLGDKFSIQTDLIAQNAQGKKTTVTISKVEDGKTSSLEKKSISIDNDDFFRTEEFIVDANSAGVSRYRISISPIADEVSRANNYKDIFVQVLDARQQILILGNAPHPDLAALAQIVSNNKNYEATIKLADDSYDLSAYNQVILHNLPSRKNRIDNLVTTAKELRIPLLYIVGSQTDPRRFNQSQDVIAFRGNGQTLEEITPYIGSDFSKFTTSDALKNTVPTFPPLLAPFGEYREVATADNLLYQSIKKIETGYPLLSFQEQSGVKTGIWIGEGIWKWRLYDFLQHDNYDIISEVVNKSIQYISNKKDNRKFICTPTKNIYKENEAISINAQLYNDNYELITDPEVNLSVYSQEGNEFKYVMSRKGDYYSSDLGKLPPGNYSYKGVTSINAQNYADQGKFSIQEIQLESYELSAKHFVLENLSSQSNGKLYYKENIESLADEILLREDIKPVIYNSVKTSMLMDNKWLFALLFLALAVEWILRRYYGSY